MRLFVRKINISNYNLLCGESEKKIFLALCARGKKKKSKEQKGKRAKKSPRGEN